MAYKGKLTPHKGKDQEQGEVLSKLMRHLSPAHEHPKLDPAHELEKQQEVTIKKENDLEERVHLWKNLVQPHREPNLEELYGDSNFLNECHQYVYNWIDTYQERLSLRSLGAALTFIFIPLGIDVFQIALTRYNDPSYVFTTDYIIFTTGIMLLFLSGLLALTGLVLYIYQNFKVKSLNHFEKMAYLNNTSFTITNKDINGRQTACSEEQECNKTLAQQFKWFNNWESSKSNMAKLIVCYPELNALLEQRISNYPLSYEQLIAHINNEVSQEMEDNALREFLTLDNKLSTRDLHALNKALTLHQQMENAGLPTDEIHKTVREYLIEYFADFHQKHQNKEVKQYANEYIQNIRQMLLRVEPNIPNHVFARLKILAKHTSNVEELYNSEKEVDLYVIQLEKLWIANPHVQVKWDWHALLLNLNSIDDLTQFIKNYYDELIIQIKEKVKKSIASD